MVTASCPNPSCGKKLSITKELSGKQVKCRDCQATFIVVVVIETGKGLQFNQPPPEVDLQKVLGRNPGEGLMFCRQIKKPEVMLKIISAFANTKGGQLVVGFDHKTKQFSKVNHRSIDKLVDDAEEEIGDHDIARVDFYPVDDHEVAIISICPTKSPSLGMGTRGIKKVDSAGKIRTMKNQEIIARFADKASPADIGGTMITLNATVKDTSDRLKEVTAELERAKEKIQSLENVYTVGMSGREKIRAFLLQKTMHGVWAVILPLLGGLGVWLVEKTK